MTITKEQVLQALSHVEEPDLKKDLVTLNMVRDIEVEGNAVRFSIVLTTPACPLKDLIERACINAIHHFIDANTEVTVNMTSQVTTMRQDRSILPGVKNIIAVASGKGGVGKSTVSTNLAQALALKGAKVGLLDADIYGPSIPIMFGLQGHQPEVIKRDNKEVMIPIEKHGIKLFSIGFLVPEGKAVVWRGPMISSALRQFVNDVDWGELDYLVIDLPPGTGDIHLTMAQTMPLTGVVIVTTPQKVAVSDARKAMDMFTMPMITTPMLGIVENMAYFSPDDAPEKRYYIFGSGGGEQLAGEFQVPLLGQVPIVEHIRETGDEGTPAVLNLQTRDGQAFMELAENMARQVALRNAEVAQTV